MFYSNSICLFKSIFERKTIFLSIVYLRLFFFTGPDRATGGWQEVLAERGGGIDNGSRDGYNPNVPQLSFVFRER